MHMNNVRKLYPTAALYNAIRDAIHEVRANLQAPEALIGGSFLTAMSIACQGDINVELPTGQIRPVNLYIATIADSGERKTATDSLVMAPIYDYDARHKENHDRALIIFQTSLSFWKKADNLLQRMLLTASVNGEDTSELNRMLAAHASGKPRKPARNRIVHQSITERPMMDSLRGNGRCIAILSDEGETVLKGGATNKMAPLNKAWDGSKVLTFERADDIIEVTNPRVTISFMVQDKVFNDFMRKRGDLARGSGLLARFLISYPESTQGFRYMSLQDPVWNHLPKFHQRIAELLDAREARHKAGDTLLKVLRFSPEAKELYARIQNYIEPQLRQGGPLASVRDAASKLMENAGRIAAILHHFTDQEGNVISYDTLHRAIEIADWYLIEFTRLFDEQNAIPQIEKDKHTIVEHLFRKYWCQGYTQAGWNDVRNGASVRDQVRFEAAIWQLCNEGVISYAHVPNPSGRGKGKQMLFLNHAAFQRLCFQ